MIERKCTMGKVLLDYGYNVYKTQTAVHLLINWWNLLEKCTGLFFIIQRIHWYTYSGREDKQSFHLCLLYERNKWKWWFYIKIKIKKTAKTSNHQNHLPIKYYDCQLLKVYDIITTFYKL